MTIGAEDMLTESQLIEQEGGRLKYFMRNHDKRHSTAVAYSDNGGESWHDYRLDDDLPQPICQMSVIKLRSTESRAWFSSTRQTGINAATAPSAFPKTTEKHLHGRGS